MLWGGNPQPLDTVHASTAAAGGRRGSRVAYLSRFGGRGTVGVLVLTSKFSFLSQWLWVTQSTPLHFLIGLLLLCKTDPGTNRTVAPFLIINIYSNISADLFLNVSINLFSFISYFSFFTEKGKKRTTKQIAGLLTELASWNEKKAIQYNVETTQPTEWSVQQNIYEDQ